MATEQEIQQRAKEIGDAPAFPVPPSNYHKNIGMLYSEHYGMTYRQWLIGQAMSNPSGYRIQYADSVLRDLAKEQLEGGAK